MNSPDLLSIYIAWCRDGQPNDSPLFNTVETVEAFVEWLLQYNGKIWIDTGYGFPLEIGFPDRYNAPDFCVALDAKERRLNVFQSGDCIMANVISITPNSDPLLFAAGCAAMDAVKAKVLKEFGLD